MVRVGFIVEGGCERIVLNSSGFSNFLSSNHLQLIGEVIDMNGKGNLSASSKRMQSQVKLLRNEGAEWIIVLRDMDNAVSFGSVKSEVFQAPEIIVCLAVQELEAWFIADYVTLSVFIGNSSHHREPETILKPAVFINEHRRLHTGRGIKDKKGFATAMVNNGFTIERAAEHPNCPSARYFLDKLQTLASVG